MKRKLKELIGELTELFAVQGEPTVRLSGYPGGF